MSKRSACDSFCLFEKEKTGLGDTSEVTSLFHTRTHTLIQIFRDSEWRRASSTHKAHTHPKKSKPKIATLWPSPFNDLRLTMNFASQLHWQRIWQSGPRQTAFSRWNQTLTIVSPIKKSPSSAQDRKWYPKSAQFSGKPPFLCTRLPKNPNRTKN